MIKHHNLNITLTDKEYSQSFPTYWLRIVQDEQDDLITGGEAAELVDELYGIDPCIATEEQAPDEEEQEELEEVDLYRVAADVFGQDLVACRVALSGDYTVDVKIFRSHPDEPYKLVLSAGEVVRTIITTERVITTIDVKSATSIELEAPVEGNLSAGWLGSVIGTFGVTSAPKIRFEGNRLYWDGEAVTGMLRAEYDTVYDLVTVEVPGVPIFPASDVGTTQDVKVLAFYHMMVFPGEIHKPIEDDSITTGELKQLCGYNDSGIFGDSGDTDAPIPEPLEPPKYGCQAWEPALADPETYLAFCCKSDPKPYACVLSTAPNPGGKGISQEDVTRFLNINPNTSFQAVTPSGAEGCGTIYYELAINKNNCCDDIVPMSAHADNPTEIFPGGNVILEVLDGRIEGLWRWHASGGLLFQNGLSVMLGRNVMQVFAPSGMCPDNVVRVDDGCTVLTMPLHNPSVSALSIFLTDNGTDSSIPAGSRTALIEGGVPPYSLTITGSHTSFVNGEQSVTITESGSVQFFMENEQICEGIFQVVVSDSCADLDSLTIDPGDVPGMACVRYSTYYASLWDWGLNGGVPVEASGDFPKWFMFTSLEYFTTVLSNVTPLPYGGKFYLVTGDGTPAFVDIGQRVGNETPIRWYSLVNWQIVNNFCVACE